MCNQINHGMRAKRRLAGSFGSSRRVAAVWSVVLAGWWALSAGSALAEPRIEGVQDGQRVTGAVAIWAQATQRASGIRIELIGPEGVIRNRASGSRVALVEGEGSRAGVLDTRSLPEGDYTLTVTTDFRGINNDSKTISFKVAREASAPAAAPVPATGGSMPAVSLKPVQPVTQVRVEPPASSAPEDGDATWPQVEAAPDVVVQMPGDVAWDVRFSQVLGQAIRLGDSPDLPLEITGELPEGFDVVVQAWHLDRDGIIDAFSHTLGKGPWVVRRAMLDTLTAGNVELQLLVRSNGNILQTVKQRYWVEPALGDGLMPAIAFAKDAPATYVKGNKRPIGLTIEGAMPRGGDVMVVAWNMAEQRVESAFTHMMSQPPYQVSDERLDALADGGFVLQAYTRLNGKIFGRVSHTVTVQKGAVADSGGSVGGGSGSDSGGGGGSGGEPVDLGVTFASGAPGTYKPGESPDIRVNIAGTLPDGADVMLLAWSDAQRRMVSEFAHPLPANGRVDINKLATLPGGTVQLQAMLRVPDVGNQFAYHNLVVDKPVEAPVPVPPPVVTPGAGFTSFKASADTRVVYVSASGNDANSGLSPDAPIKSISRAKSMVRDGYPDWLLFKAGDVFNSGIGTWDKSGRSSSERMLVGVYGSGDRPVFRTQGDGGLQVYKALRHVAFVGLQFHAVKRDPSRPEFNAASMPLGETGIKLYPPPGLRDILFEDLRIGFYKDNITMTSQKNNRGDLRDVVIRRCIIHNAHSNASRGGHSQGIFANHTEGLLIEESTFDHNGWNPRVSGSMRTIFNHNIYLNSYNGPVTLRGNIIMRGGSHGSQVRPGGTVEGNLYVRNAMALFVAQNSSVVRGNVVLQSDDIGSGTLGRGDGLEVLPANGVVVEGNIFSQKAGSAGHHVAITVKWEDSIVSFSLKDFVTDYQVRLRHNIVYKWDTSYDSAIRITTGRADIKENYGNQLDVASGGKSDPPFADPGRNVETYMSTLKQPATLDRFSALVVGRPRGVWDGKLSAQGVNSYIRQGFSFGGGD